MADTPTEQAPATQPNIDARVASLETGLSTLISRVSSAESNISSLVQSANKILGEHLPAIHDKIVSIEAALGTTAEADATDVMGFIGERIAAIEAWLSKTPQAHGATFTPPQPAQAATKPA